MRAGMEKSTAIVHTPPDICRGLLHCRIDSMGSAIAPVDGGRSPRRRAQNRPGGHRCDGRLLYVEARRERVRRGELWRVGNSETQWSRVILMVGADHI